MSVEKLIERLEAFEIDGHYGPWTPDETQEAAKALRDQQQKIENLKWARTVWREQAEANRKRMDELQREVEALRANDKIRSIEINRLRKPIELDQEWIDKVSRESEPDPIVGLPDPVLKSLPVDPSQGFSLVGDTLFYGRGPYSHGYNLGLLTDRSYNALDILNGPVIQRKGYISECHEVEHVLGKALGYPWFKDDQANFPGATEEDGVCVGEHVPGTIAREAARKIREQQDKIEQLLYERDRMQRLAYERTNETVRLEEEIERLLKLLRQGYIREVGDDQHFETWLSSRR